MMKIKPLELFTIRRIFDFIKIPIFAIDYNRDILMWNNSMVEFSGILPNEAIGKKASEIAGKVYSKNNHFVSELFFDEKLKNEFENFEIIEFDDHVVCVSKDDEYFIVKASPFFDKRGNLMGAVEILMTNKSPLKNNKIEENKLKKVYIADDSKWSRNILKEILKGEGIEDISEFSNGNSLIAKVFREKPDLIFLDLLMPGLKGEKVAKAIKENFPDILITVLAANIQKNVEKELKNCGVDFFVSKPVAKEKIRAIFKDLRGGKNDI